MFDAFVLAILFIIIFLIGILFGWCNSNSSSTSPDNKPRNDQRDNRSNLVQVITLIVIFLTALITYRQTKLNSKQLALMERNQAVTAETYWPLLTVKKTVITPLKKNVGKYIFHLENGGEMPGIIKEMRLLPLWTEGRWTGEFGKGASFNTSRDRFKIKKTNVLFASGELKTRPAFRIDLTELNNQQGLRLVAEFDYCTVTLSKENCRTTFYDELISLSGKKSNSTHLTQMLVEYSADTSPADHFEQMYSRIIRNQRRFSTDEPGLK